MFKLSFETSNAAFDDGPATEAARILRAVARKVEEGFHMGSGAIRDANGNAIGHWEMTP